jgi:hypothetical protein
MSKQRYVAVLADETGSVITKRSTIAEMVSAMAGAKEQRLETNGVVKSTSQQESAFRDYVEAKGYSYNDMSAVIKVESGGVSRIDGRIITRFEPHVFSRLLLLKNGFKNDKNNRMEHSITVFLPGMIIPTGVVVLETTKLGNRIIKGGDINYKYGYQRFSDRKRSYKERQAIEYEAIKLAAKFDPELAHRSSSWGFGQIMGFNFEVLGYRSAIEMANSFADDWIQKRAVVDFIDNYSIRDEETGLTAKEAFKQRNFEAFARVYNGDTSGKYAKQIISNLT